MTVYVVTHYDRHDVWNRIVGVAASETVAESIIQKELDSRIEEYGVADPQFYRSLHRDEYEIESYTVKE